MSFEWHYKTRKMSGWAHGGLTQCEFSCIDRTAPELYNAIQMTYQNTLQFCTIPCNKPKCNFDTESYLNNLISGGIPSVESWQHQPRWLQQAASICIVMVDLITPILFEYDKGIGNDCQCFGGLCFGRRNCSSWSKTRGWCQGRPFSVSDVNNAETDVLNFFHTMYTNIIRKWQN